MAVGYTTYLRALLGTISGASDLKKKKINLHLICLVGCLRSLSSVLLWVQQALGTY